MRFEAFVWLAMCLAIALMVLESVDYNRWRWSIAGLLAFTSLVAVLMAIGRLLI